MSRYTQTPLPLSSPGRNSLTSGRQRYTFLSQASNAAFSGQQRWSSCHSIASTINEQDSLPPVEEPQFRSEKVNVDTEGPSAAVDYEEEEEKEEEEEEEEEEKDTVQKPTVTPNLKKIAWVWPELKRRNAICEEIEEEMVFDGVSLVKLRQRLVCCLARFHMT